MSVHAMLTFKLEPGALVGDPNALFTWKDRRTNILRHNVTVDGWPEEIEWREPHLIPGPLSVYDHLLGLIKDGTLHVRFVKDAAEREALLETYAKSAPCVKPRKLRKDVACPWKWCKPDAEDRKTWYKRKPKSAFFVHPSDDEEGEGECRNTKGNAENGVGLVTRDANMGAAVTEPVEAVQVKKRVRKPKKVYKSREYILDSDDEETFI